MIWKDPRQNIMAFSAYACCRPWKRRV